MEARSFTVLLLWFLINVCVVRGIFYFGFNHDPGIIGSFLISLLIFQMIAIVVARSES